MLQNNFLIALIIIISITGCNSKRSAKIITINPATITVEYYGVNQFVKASNLAQDYCDSIERDAKFLATEKQMVSLLGHHRMRAEFVCIPKQCKNNDNSSDTHSNLNIILPLEKK